MAIPSKEHTPLPLKPDGTIDVELIKEQYMSHEGVSWKTFCEKYGYHEQAARRRVPVAEWREEKRNKIIQERSEELGDLFFERKYSWNKDVNNTLGEYPKAIDQVFMLMKGRLQQWSKAYVKMAEGNDAEFTRISTQDLTRMAEAMSKLQAAKYRSLLLHDFTVRLADQEHENQIKDAQQVNKPFTVEIMNMGRMEMRDLEQLYDRYLDKPKKVVETDES